MRGTKINGERGPRRGRRDGYGESRTERQRERESDRGGEEGREREGRSGGKEEGTEREGREPAASQASVGRGQACRREPVCRAAAGSCSSLGAPGPGEGERPLARSMSFSDSSATFLLNEVNAGALSPVGGRRTPLQARKRAFIWGRLQ